MPRRERLKSAPKRSPAPGSPYLALITGNRLQPSSVSGRDLETEMLSDYTRIVASTGFRRLQAKAQVFSLEENAAVRTRLTHTLEVAMYGGLIGKAVFTALREKGEGAIEEQLGPPFIQTAQNACLLHDIGNPPFGHLGEFAIRGWFRDQRETITDFWKKLGISSEEIRRHYHGFEHFDGNAQGLRIVSRLQWLNHEFGLNLTCTLLASMVKYLASEPLKGQPFATKAGFFETEKATILQVWKELALRSDENRPLQRHPLTFIMEAADDISYCLSDIEDAIEKGIVAEGQFLQQLPSFLKEFQKDAGEGGKLVARDSNFITFRINLSRYLVRAATEAFVLKEGGILDGSFDKHLLDLDKRADDALQWLKKYAKDEIFPSREAVYIELSGHQVIRGILDRFLPVLTTSTADFARLLPKAVEKPKYGELALEQRLVSLLPEKHRIAYQFDVGKTARLEPIFRAHLVLDYLAGMTDNHALKVFRMLGGISTGM